MQRNGRTAATKRFLAGYEGKLPLLPVIEKHGDVVFRFNAWIISGLSQRIVKL